MKLFHLPSFPFTIICSAVRNSFALLWRGDGVPCLSSYFCCHYLTLDVGIWVYSSSNPDQVVYSEEEVNDPQKMLQKDIGPKVVQTLQVRPRDQRRCSSSCNVQEIPKKRDVGS